MLDRLRVQVDPTSNVGELCSQSAKGLLFENVKGYPGWRIAADLVQDRAAEGLVLGCEPSAVVPHLAEVLAAGPGETVQVSDGPVKTKKMLGRDVDLFSLPVCRHSELDGGRYIGAGIGITLDPETGLQNTTFPRTQLVSARHARMYLFSPHTWQNFAKWRQAGYAAMPMAIVIGHHPAYEIAAGFSGNHVDWGEEELTGRLLGTPFEVVQCETCDIKVPATAEIVLEGEVPLGSFEEEGPFANFMGNYVLSNEKQPTFELKGITMREDAIYRHIQATFWTDHQRLYSVQIEAGVYRLLKDAGLEVHDVHIPNWGGSLLTIVQLTPRHDDDAQRAIELAAEWPATVAGLSKLCIAVDDDVNIYDAREVLWAMSVRSDTPSAVKEIARAQPSPLGKTRLGFNATRPIPKSDRERFLHQKARPAGWGTVRLEDFLSAS